MGTAASSQGLIIGLTVGAAALAIIIIVILICCCCRKTERAINKRGMQRLEKQTEEQRKEMKTHQAERKSEMLKKHDEIREKYGLGKNSQTQGTAQANPENIFSVENEQEGKG